MPDVSHYVRLTRDERDLTRLADGSLDGARRTRLERLVAASPELQARLREQCRALSAIRSAARAERAPLSLRMQIRAEAGRERPRTSALGLGLGLATAAGALAWTLAVAGGPATLTVAQTAAIAARPATVSVSKPPEDQVTLPRPRAAGLPFPYWEDHFGWWAAGSRTDHLDGRLLTTVFYRRGREEIAYTIVPGGALPAVAGAHIAVRAGTMVTVSASAGRRVVTWLRRGHTCVLSGRGVPIAALTALAGWRGSGQIPY